MATGDLSDPICVGRYGACDRVVLFASAHPLRREHDQLMHDRSGGDVELRAADHNSVAITVHHANVQIRVILFRRRQGTVALGVGDQFGKSHITCRAVVEPGVDFLPGGIVGFRQVRRRAEQRHGDRGEAERDIVIDEQITSLPQVLYGARHQEHGVASVGTIAVESVVTLGHDARKRRGPGPPSRRQHVHHRGRLGDRRIATPGTARPSSSAWLLR